MSLKVWQAMALNLPKLVRSINSPATKLNLSLIPGTHITEREPAPKSCPLTSKWPCVSNKLTNYLKCFLKKKYGENLPSGAVSKSACWTNLTMTKFNPQITHTKKKKKTLSKAVLSWWHTPLTLALGRRGRWSSVSLRSAWSTEWDPVSKNSKQINK